jgi:hypothetical protein
MQLNNMNHIPKSVSLPKWLIGLVDISLVNLGLYLSFMLYRQ